jgi:hypothetical protein
VRVVWSFFNTRVLEGLFLQVCVVWSFFNTRVLVFKDSFFGSINVAFLVNLENRGF